MKNNNASYLIVFIICCIFSSDWVFTSENDLRNFIGKKICREAQGPDDTASFTIQLLKDGKIKGKGNFSGATANYSLSSGTWEQQNDKIEITLIYSGKKYGGNGKGKGERTIKIRIFKSDLLNNSAGCFNFTGPL